MANLKEKILQSLKNNKELGPTLNTLSKSQENLLKNYSNPVINNKDKGKLLKSYTDLQDIGKSVYRYNTLQEHNYSKDAQDEKANIETKVLKGGVSYNKYIWHSENGEHTCDVCADLDGQEFDYYDEVPERPHPNCKCYVEIVEYEDENSAPEPSENEEHCDCWEKIDDLVAETNSWQEEIEPKMSELTSIVKEDYDLLYEIKNLKQQVENSQSELTNIEVCGDNCVAYITGMAINITDDKNLENMMENISGLTNESRQVYQIFLEHKHEMEEARDGMDKYYHAKANCTSAELGYIQALWAGLYSILKELKDYVYKVFKYHMDYKEVAKDCWQDLKADWYGIQKAKEHGYCSDKVKDVYKDVFKQE